jgi:hypothetical protein
MDSALEKAQVSQTDDTLKSTNGPNDAEIDLKDPQKANGGDSGNLRLDKHGLPLVPQPTEHKDDPLVSPSTYIKTLDDSSDFDRTGHPLSSYSSLSKSAG